MKKSFKHAATLAIAATMALGMAACGGKSDTTTQSRSASGSDATQAAQTEATQEADTTAEAETTEAAGPIDDSMYDWSTTEAEIVENERFTTVEGADAIGVDFEKNETDGFTTYSNGAQFSMKAVNHELEVVIDNNGTLEHSVQVYYDGFTMAKGCVYTVSFDISSTIERSAMWRVQVNGGDYHAYAMDVVKIGPEMQTITKEFTMEENSDPAPRFVFNLGDVTGDESGLPPHTICIDNISLFVTDSSNAEIIQPAPTPNKVLVNQIGYKPDDTKTVLVTDANDEHFKVCKADTDETVFIGDYGEAEKFYSTNTKIRTGDFSELKTPGEYYIVSAPSGRSYNFKIGDGLYDDVYKDVILMLYKQRCGLKLDPAIAGDFAHEECHKEEATIYGDDSGKTVEVSGGWHDAGDCGRYVVPGAKTVQDLFLTYEDFNYTADDIGIPESGNGTPDLLDEARYELDWMFKMQDEATGGVYHKVTPLVFPEFSLPEDEKDPLVLAPISTAATADFAAVMAKASVIYKDYDAAFASKALDASKKAYEYIKANKPSGYKNPKEIVTGEYPDGSLDDEPVWASIELYLATGDESYLKDFNEYKERFYSYGLGWASIGYYPMYDAAKAEGIDAELQSFAKETIIKGADKLVDDCGKSGLFVGLSQNFPWGSNMNIANEAMLLMMANKLEEKPEYMDLVNKHRDYIFGANGVGYCYVTGYGTLTPEHTHHRLSQTIGKTMPGMLVGGANSDLSDPYAKAVLTGVAAPAQCYVDNDQSYSCNEITIYWNSPLIYMMTGMSK